MQNGYESVESLLLALTKFSTADIAKCPPILIWKARQLLEGVTVPSLAPLPRPQDEGDLTPATVPSPASPRPQDEGDLTPATVPSPAPPPRQQDEGDLTPVAVPSPASPRQQD